MEKKKTKVNEDNINDVIEDLAKSCNVSKEFILLILWENACVTKDIKERVLEILLYEQTKP